MKLFLTKIIVILFIGLGIALLLDILISNQLKKSLTFGAGEVFIWNKIYNGQVNDDIFIYGSSRAMVHFDPEIIEKELRMSVYNLGIDGHNFWLQYLRHLKLMEYNSKPKHIILSVGIGSLRKRNDLLNYDQFLPFIFDKDIYQFTKEYQGFSIFDYKIPLFRYSGKQDAIKLAIRDIGRLDKNIPVRNKGFKAQNRSWYGDMTIIEQKRLFGWINFHKESELLMNQFLKECQDLDINVIIVYSPEYTEGQKIVGNRNHIINTFKDMASHYNFPFLDYSNDSICLKKSLFYNNSHLNQEGSKLFSEIFAKDLKIITTN